MENIYHIYCDGAARGNPGPAASAFVVQQQQQTIHQLSHYLGVTTNNVAEYTALNYALTWIQEQNIPSANITIFMDSQLVVNQINGLYKIKQPHLQQLSQISFQKIAHLRQTHQLNIQHITREHNNLADGLANQQLDLQHLHGK